MTSNRRSRPAAQAYHPGAYDPATGYPYEDVEWNEPRPRGRTVTPARFLLVLVLLVAGAVALYGMFFDRTPLQIPIAVSGLTVFGIALVAMALVAARSAASLGRTGSGGRAFLAAIFGGLCALGAAGSLAGAFVLGILTL